MTQELTQEEENLVQSIVEEIGIHFDAELGARSSGFHYDYGSISSWHETGPEFDPDWCQDIKITNYEDRILDNLIEALDYEYSRKEYRLSSRRNMSTGYVKVSWYWNRHKDAIYVGCELK